MGFFWFICFELFVFYLRYGVGGVIILRGRCEFIYGKCLDEGLVRGEYLVDVSCCFRFYKCF